MASWDVASLTFRLLAVFVGDLVTYFQRREVGVLGASKELTLEAQAAQSAKECVRNNRDRRPANAPPAACTVSWESAPTAALADKQVGTGLHGAVARMIRTSPRRYSISKAALATQIQLITSQVPASSTGCWRYALAAERRAPRYPPLGVA